jgi:hypothetical protein
VLDILSARRVPDDVTSALKLVAPEESVVITDEPARGMLGPFLWLCDRARGGGLQLTAVGRLKPAGVTALMTELGWSSWWIGKANREDLTQPAQWLRESATRVGLVRKYKGRLLLTRQGERLESDPVAGLMAIAERLPVETDTASEVAGTLVLLDQLVAAAQAESTAAESAPAREDVDDAVSEESSTEARLAALVARHRQRHGPLLASGMAAMGWGGSDGRPLTPDDVWWAAERTTEVLFCLGLTSIFGSDGAGSSTPGARQFLRAALTRPLDAEESAGPPKAQPCHTLLVALKDVEPTVWRRIVVPSSYTLSRLHEVIQGAMGWTNSHLYLFDDGHRRYGVPSPDWPELDVADAARVRLGKALPEVGSTITYEYDFGDGWEHTVLVEQVETVVGAPSVLAGANACPPEDVGGPGGYADFLAVLANPADPQHDFLLSWAGGSFDATAFDLGRANGEVALTVLAGRRRRR